jgi:PAS domain S-box-containing protein
MRAKLRLKHFLIVSLISVAIIPLLIISYITMTSFSGSFEEEITNKNQLLARSLVGEVEQFLSQTATVIDQLADMIEDRKLVGIDQVSPHLESLVRHYYFFDMIQILDRNGTILQLAPFKRDYLGMNLSGYRFFKETNSLRQTTWSAAFTSFQTGQPTIAVARPVTNGMIVGYLNVTRIADITDQVNLGPDSWVGIVDRNGQIISHTDPFQVYQQVNIKNKLIVQKGLTGKPGVFFYRQNGKEYLGIVAIVPKTGWPVIVSQALTEAFTPVRNTRALFIAGILAGLVLAVAIAMRSLNKIMKPLAELAGQANEVACGRYEDLTVSDSYEEFNQLATDFRAMTDAIHNRELALRESEERYALAVIGANDGLWDWNIRTNQIYFSLRWKEILGFSDAEFPNEVWQWETRIHPDDREQVFTKIDAHLRGDSANFQYEYRMRHKDGSYRWVLARGLALRDPTGHPYRMAGSHTDITERKINEKKILEALIEKEILLKEVHHRVKNNLQIIASLLRLQGDTIKDPHTFELFTESLNRIRSITLVHEKLYQSPDLSRIGFKEYVNILVGSLFQTFGNRFDAITYRVEIDEQARLGLDAAIACGLIINELVSDSLVYAFREREDGEIVIRFEQFGDRMELSIMNNGAGITADKFEAAGTLGFQLVKVLVSQLQGQVSFHGDQGTEFRIVFQEG